MTLPFRPEDQRLSPLRRMSALESVRSRIGLAIQLNLLSPGEELPPIDQMAEAFEVSEVTVRRAMVALTKQGIVVRHRGRSGGTFVADEPPIDQIASIAELQSLHASARELIDRRLVQETGLIHLALDHLNDESLESLDALVREMDEASGWAQFHTLDVRFHRAIASMAHAPAALDDYFSVTDALYAFYLPYPMSYLFTSNDEHRALVAAMRAGDRPQCHHLAARHVAVLHQTMFFGLTDATGAED